MALMSVPAAAPAMAKCAVSAAFALPISDRRKPVAMASTLQESVPARYPLDPMGGGPRLSLLSAAEVAAPNLN